MSDHSGLEPGWPESVEVAEACAQLLLGRRIGRLLDAGGGTGFLTWYLMNSRVVDGALVLDRRADRLARVPPPIATKCGRVEDLDAADGQFSTILIRQVLHYLAAPAPALRRLGTRLRPGGAIYVGQLVAPDQEAARWLGESARWLTPDRHRVWTVDRMLGAFAEAGLRLERATVVPQWQALHDGARVGGPVRVREARDAVYGRVLWLHALLVPDAPP